jgi:hypothetical protein
MAIKKTATSPARSRVVPRPAPPRLGRPPPPVDLSQTPSHDLCIRIPASNRAVAPYRQPYVLIYEGRVGLSTTARTHAIARPTGQTDRFRINTARTVAIDLSLGSRRDLFGA